MLKSVRLGYYTAMSGDSVPTFRDNLPVPSSRVKKSKKKCLLLGLLDPLRWDPIGCPETSGTELSLYAAQYPRRAQISSTLWRKPETTHSVLYFIVLYSRTRSQYGTKADII